MIQWVGQRMRTTTKTLMKITTIEVIRIIRTIIIMKSIKKINNKNNNVIDTHATKTSVPNEAHHWLNKVFIKI